MCATCVVVPVALYSRPCSTWPRRGAARTRTVAREPTGTRSIRAARARRTGSCRASPKKMRCAPLLCCSADAERPPLSAPHPSQALVARARGSLNLCARGCPPASGAIDSKKGKHLRHHPARFGALRLHS